MNYELAKKLKDAGFILKRGWCPGIGVEEHPLENCEGIPNLSELIEACGDGFQYLMRYNTSLGFKWQAFSYNLKMEKTIASGSTPDEAVANLWLSLTNK